jgi:hypothetical protein
MPPLNKMELSVMQSTLPRVCAILLALTVTACATNGPVTTDVCPAWLRVVTPIFSHPSDTDRTRDRIAALGEAGQAVGCW